MKIKTLTNLQKTLGLLIFGSFIFFLAGFTIQSQANKSFQSCSYLDPVIVDIAALIFAGFLIFDGLQEIFSHRAALAKKQLARCIRIWIAVSIMTIHIMQFIHK